MVLPKDIEAGEEANPLLAGATGHCHRGAVLTGPGAPTPPTPVSVLRHTPVASALRKAFSRYESGPPQAASESIPPLPPQGPASSRRFFVQNGSGVLPSSAKNRVVEPKQFTSSVAPPLRVVLHDKAQTSKPAVKAHVGANDCNGPALQGSAFRTTVRRRLFSVTPQRYQSGVPGRAGRPGNVPTTSTGVSVSVAEPPEPNFPKPAEGARRINVSVVPSPSSTPAPKRRRVSFGVPGSGVEPSSSRNARTLSKDVIYVSGSGKRTQPAAETGPGSGGRRGVKGPLQVSLQNGIREARERMLLITGEKPPSSGGLGTVRAAVAASLVVEVEKFDQPGAPILGRVLARTGDGSIDAGERVSVLLGTEEDGVDVGCILFVPQPWSILRDTRICSFGVEQVQDAIVFAHCASPLPHHLHPKEDDRMGQIVGTLDHGGSLSLPPVSNAAIAARTRDFEGSDFPPPVSVKQHVIFSGIAPHERVVGLVGRVLVSSENDHVALVRDGLGQFGVLKSHNPPPCRDGAVDLGFWRVATYRAPAVVIEALLGEHGDTIPQSTHRWDAPVFNEVETNACVVQRTPVRG